MKKKNKKKEDEIYNDCWLYVLLLTTLVILLESIKKYTFSIGQANLTYGIFLLPIQYFIVSYIAKKYDYKKAISAIAISGVFLVCFSATISFFLKESLILTNVSGEFFGYVVSQFVFLQIYLFLLNNTKFPPLIVYLDYLFSIFVFYIVYTLVYIYHINLNHYWTGFFITMLIQGIICIALVYVDCKIKRGQEKIK